MSVGKLQCKQNFKHFRRITLGILFLVLLQSNLLGVNGFFSVKLCFDGSLDRYKARLVALGNKQEYGVDYEETFAPVVKMTTVRTILAIAASQSWRLHQMDVKNAFLHGDLQEEIYMKLHSGMTTSSPHDVCKHRCSLYGLKQEPRAWFEKFRSTLLSFNFTQSQFDSSLLLHTSTSGIVILLVYVDDIIITGIDCDLIMRRHLPLLPK